MIRILLHRANRASCISVQSMREFSRFHLNLASRRLPNRFPYNKGDNSTVTNVDRAHTDENNDSMMNISESENSEAHVKNLLRQSLVENISPEKINPDFPSDVSDYYLSRYKGYTESVEEQEQLTKRPNIKPSERSVLLFPGQGSQFVGMGRQVLDYPKVERLYERASEILGYDLLDICLNGPAEKLNQTVHCQPAVVVTSLAAVEKLKEQNPWAVENCVSAAGYSVGEFSALVFAGALTFEDALQVIKKRAEAMQQASEAVPGKMMTVHLRPDARINFACHAARRYCIEELNMENAVCEVSNFLYPSCKIISGNSEALQFLEINADEFGIRRVQYLPVSGAFHSQLMTPAKQTLLDTLKTVSISNPRIPVHSNVNSFKYRSSDTVVKLLAEQIYKPVLWEQTMHVMYSRPIGDLFPHTFEVGPGRQLGAMLLKVNKKAYEMYKNITV